MKFLLDIVTKFSNDIDMKFGLKKCAYLCINKGKIVTSKEPILINNIAIDLVKEGDSYKYLCQDEKPWLCWTNQQGKSRKGVPKTSQKNLGK